MDLNPKYEIPVDFQIFFNFCSSFGNVEDCFIIFGSKTSSEKVIIEIKTEKNEQNLLKIGTVDVDSEVAVDFFISLDSENFGEIICFEDGCEIKSNMKFHQFIKSLFEFLFEFENEEFDTFEENLDEVVYNDNIWRMFADETITCYKLERHEFNEDKLKILQENGINGLIRIV